MAELVDPDRRIVRLFTPPLERTRQDPGYIKAYPPGVRENGGQYTHAATWVALAFAEQGRAEEAWRVFQMLNPVSHALSREDADHYRVEPYVVAADIYGEGALAGRGGWTWYTGFGRLALPRRRRGHSRHPPTWRQAGHSDRCCRRPGTATRRK